MRGVARCAEQPKMSWLELRRGFYGKCEITSLPSSSFLRLSPLFLLYNELSRTATSPSTLWLPSSGLSTTSSTWLRCPASYSWRLRWLQRASSASRLRHSSSAASASIRLSTAGWYVLLSSGGDSTQSHLSLLL